MASVADLVARDIEVLLTHGNGPQVGNLLVKNELAASVVPPVPLDWCGAQTQATLGFVLMDALDAALARRGVVRRTAAVVTRTRVDAGDPGFVKPTKPIGRFLPRGRGGAAHRARRDVGGPRSQGVAAGRRVTGAAGDHRRPGRLGPGRRRVHRDRQRRRRDPRRTRRGRHPARCRGGHRQGPRRRPARPHRHRRRTRHRHRRAERDPALRHPRGAADRADLRRRGCVRWPPRAISPAARWDRRSTRPAGSSRKAAATP